jgi:hypothetical protein
MVMIKSSKTVTLSPGWRTHDALASLATRASEKRSPGSEPISILLDGEECPIRNVSTSAFSGAILVLFTVDKC